jgi:superfamily I DNA and/or RNA helicase
MDEASQLKPEDAIGAIARGGQIVIVGDPKQLPPTSFFQRVSLDAEEDSADDSRTAVEEGESILDVASMLFQPVRRLRWHCRSRHHSLIEFLNNEFCQGDLIILPSA